MSGGVKIAKQIIYKIKVPENRYDLLCLEGLAQAMRVFLRLDPDLPDYKLSGEPQRPFSVKKEVSEVRPYVVCAVLRGLKTTTDVYFSLIDLQEKLHQRMCRRRSTPAYYTGGNRDT